MFSRIRDKIWFFFLAVLLLIGVWEYIHTANGIAFIAPIIGNFPFAGKIIAVTKLLTGYTQDIPIVTNSNILNDIAKLFIASMIIMGVTSVLVRIFCTIPAYDNLSFDERRDCQEQYINRISYRAKVAFIKMLAAVVVVFLSNEILKAIYSGLAKGGMTTLKTAGYLMAMFMAFLIYSFIIGQVASIGFARGMLFGFLYKLLPQMINVFIIDAICVILYATIYTNGFGANVLIIFVVLYIWCIIAEIIETGLTEIFGKMV